VHISLYDEGIIFNCPTVKSSSVIDEYDEDKMLKNVFRKYLYVYPKLERTFPFLFFTVSLGMKISYLEYYMLHRSDVWWQVRILEFKDLIDIQDDIKADRYVTS
jgi:hypothetical protein